MTIFPEIEEVIDEIKRMSLPDDEKSKLIYLLIKTYSSQENYIIFAQSYLELLETLDKTNAKIPQRLYEFLQRDARRLKNLLEKLKT